MKIQPYQEVVGTSSVPSVRQPQTDATAFGANLGKAGQALGAAAIEAGNKMAQIAEKQAVEHDVAVVQEASTRAASMINDALYNKDSGIMNRKLKGAISADADTKTLLNDIYGDFIDNQLQNDRQRFLFTQHIGDRLNAYQAAADKHAATERQTWQNQTKDAEISANINTGVIGKDSPEVLGAAKNGILAATIERYKDAGEAVTKEKIRENVGNLHLQVVNSYLVDRREPEAIAYFDKFKNEIPVGDNRTRLEQLIVNAKNNNDGYAIANEIVKASLRPDGLIDDKKAFLMIEQRTGPGVTKAVGKAPTWDETKALVAVNETGGQANPYTTPNGAGSGAYGKYQFMPATWKATMGDTPMTPENQEIAMDKYGKPIYDKYGGGVNGARAVLVAHYAGENNVERYIKGQPLVGDDGKEYSADAPQMWNGVQHKSVREYVEGQLGGQTVAAFNPALNKLVSDIVKSKISERNAVYQQTQKDNFKNAWNQIDAGGLSFEDANSLIDNGSFDPETKRSLQVLRNRKFRITDDGTPQYTPNEVKAEFRQWINTTPLEEITPAEFNRKFLGRLSRQDEDTFGKEVINFKEGGGINWDKLIKDNFSNLDPKDDDYAHVKDGIYRMVREYRAKNNGQLPDILGQAKIVKDLKQEVIVNKAANSYSPFTKTMPLYKVIDQMPAGAYWDSDKGAFMFRDPKTNQLFIWKPDQPSR
jgi:hypothetical protein